MVHNSERSTGPVWAQPNDPRVTAVGRFLRRTHIDELPQLWNVLRGEMSLVGPRPERPEIAVKLDKSIRGYRQRLTVRPGITGLAQLHLPADTDLASVCRKQAYDLRYLRHAGLRLDLSILLDTTLYLTGRRMWFTQPYKPTPKEQSHELTRVYGVGSNGEDVAAEAA